MPNIRLMTYNVRSCIVYGQKHSPETIAEVIQSFQPDIIALQEVDVGYKFKKGIDQAHRIAELLEMNYHFHPSIEVEDGGYGNAIISRFPLEMIKAEALPRIHTGVKMTLLEKVIKVTHEPRGVLWVEADVDGKTLQVVTTHLGLTRQERLFQMDFLTGKYWLDAYDDDEPVIFCGDLNDTHRSSIYQKLIGDFHFQDIQAVVKNHKRKPTFFSHLPIRCLDHIFIKGAITAQNCLVPKNKIIAKASDHLPVIADLEL